MVSIVKQADIPLTLQGRQKLKQGAGMLGKLEAEQALIELLRRMAAHHIAHM